MDYEFRELRQFGKFLTQVFLKLTILLFFIISGQDQSINFIHIITILTLIHDQHSPQNAFQLPGIDCAWVHPATKEKYSLLVKFDKVILSSYFLDYVDYGVTFWTGIFLVMLIILPTGPGAREALFPSTGIPCLG